MLGYGVLIQKTQEKGKTSNKAKASILTPMQTNKLPDDYANLLAEPKKRIREERLRVVMAVNAAMVLLYWDIGRTNLERQKQEGWGPR